MSKSRFFVYKESSIFSSMLYSLVLIFITLSSYIYGMLPEFDGLLSEYQVRIINIADDIDSNILATRKLYFTESLFSVRLELNYLVVSENIVFS